MKTATNKAIVLAHGQTALAQHFGIKPQAVQKWQARGRIPAMRVLGVEALTGVSRHELRPDIYGPAPTGEAA